MKKTDVTIRKGGVDDLGHALHLVKELARYENAPESVVTTVQDYLADLEAGWFDLIVADAGDKIVGIALGHRAYSTWNGRMYYLDDLVVNEAHRHCGIGKMLFNAILAHARSTGARSLKWQVLEWNEPAIRFYSGWNAELDAEWVNGRIYF
jgi:GNAT superfamily N-acetyltransferase